MKTIAFALVLAAAAIAADRPAVPREAMRSVEQSVDRSIRGLDANEPYDLLGFSRGVYLAGFGAVVTAEVNLVFTPAMPFERKITPVMVTRMHQKKLQRLAVMRGLMRQTLVNAAATLDPVPPAERIVFGLTLFYSSYEDRSGLPGQIVMQAPKQALLDFKANRITKEQLDAAIQVQEL